MSGLLGDLFKKGSDVVKDIKEEAEKAVTPKEQPKKKTEIITSADGTLAKATEELNYAPAHEYYKNTLGIDLQPHLKDDGKITNEETVEIFAQLGSELINTGYLKPLPRRAQALAENQISGELTGSAKKVYEDLSPAEERAFLTLVTLPEEKKQAMLRSVEADGGLPSAKDQASLDATDAAAGYVLVDGVTGEKIDLDAAKNTETQAYVEQPANIYTHDDSPDFG